MLNNKSWTGFDALAAVGGAARPLRPLGDLAVDNWKENIYFKIEKINDFEKIKIIFFS